MGAEASELESKFVSVLIDTRVQFIKKESETKDFLERFRFTLITLPVSKKYKHLHFLSKEKNKLKCAKDVDEIFDILQPHWDYVDYALLEYVVKKFGDQSLKKKMADYVSKLETFERKTPARNFPFQRKPPLDFRNVEICTGIDSTVCSLYTVRKKREAIANAAALESYTHRLMELHASLVTITLAFPSSALAFVLPIMSTQFLKTHNILSVSIDSKPMEVYTKQVSVPTVYA